MLVCPSCDSDEIITRGSDDREESLVTCSSCETKFWVDRDGFIVTFAGQDNQE